MTIKKLLFTFLALIPFFTFSQSGYLVGTSQQGIEPDQSLISLHLGGYGAPKEGRFTLNWVARGLVGEVSSVFGFNDHLFGLNQGGLF